LTIEQPASPERIQANSGNRLLTVQMLRAVAAAMVVIGHCKGAVVHHPELFGSVEAPRFGGGAGVDIFFVVSGFIMCHASRSLFGTGARGSWEFMYRRLVRIVPLYWGATLLTVALAIAGGKGWPSPVALLTSFFFVPWPRQDLAGAMFPLLDLGWTLNYEMFFYFVFAAFLPLGKIRGVLASGAAMTLFVAVGKVVDLPGSLHFWSQPIILEFVAGMGLQLCFGSGRISLPVWARLGLVALAVTHYWIDPFQLIGRPLTPNNFERVGGWGVFGLLMMAAAVSGPFGIRNALVRFATAAGDASYALYLLHPIAIAVALRLVHVIAPQSPAAAVVFLVLALVLAFGSSMLVYRFIELPFTKFCQRRRRGPVRADIHGVAIGAK
jgi:peptidoglycan/LPS O-acetylase OafA/YrhL